MFYLLYRIIKGTKLTFIIGFKLMYVVLIAPLVLLKKIIKN